MYFLNLFILVEFSKEAYECLSDPNERKWYDDHREAILMGIKPGENTNEHAPSYVVEVTMFHHPSAYSNSYSDEEGSFFHIYGEIFSKVDGGERKGWVAQGNIDEPKARPKFGTSKSEWKEVQSFYRSWESFSSILNFAWVDEYDIREAPNRRYKRAMETENEKARRKAKKDRNDEILSLLHFVKRRDPRIKQHKIEVEQKKREKEKLKKEDASRRKAEAAIAREVGILHFLLNTRLFFLLNNFLCSRGESSRKSLWLIWKQVISMQAELGWPI